MCQNSRFEYQADLTATMPAQTPTTRALTTLWHRTTHATAQWKQMATNNSYGTNQSLLLTANTRTTQAQNTVGKLRDELQSENDKKDTESRDRPGFLSALS